MIPCRIFYRKHEQNEDDKNLSDNISLILHMAKRINITYGLKEIEKTQDDNKLPVLKKSSGNETEKKLARMIQQSATSVNPKRYDLIHRTAVNSEKIINDLMQLIEAHNEISKMYGTAGSITPLICVLSQYLKEVGLTHYLMFKEVIKLIVPKVQSIIEIANYHTFKWSANFKELNKKNGIKLSNLRDLAVFTILAFCYLLSPCLRIDKKKYCFINEIGSHDTDSDLDITIYGQYSSIVILYNYIFQDIFEKSSNDLFDNNVYGNDYNIYQKNKVSNALVVEITDDTQKEKYVNIQKYISYLRVTSDSQKYIREFNGVHEDEKMNDTLKVVLRELYKPTQGFQVTTLPTYSYVDYLSKCIEITSIDGTSVQIDELSYTQSIKDKSEEKHVRQKDESGNEVLSKLSPTTKSYCYILYKMKQLETIYVGETALVGEEVPLKLKCMSILKNMFADESYWCESTTKHILGLMTLGINEFELEMTDDDYINSFLENFSYVKEKYEHNPEDGNKFLTTAIKYIYRCVHALCSIENKSNIVVNTELIKGSNRAENIWIIKKYFKEIVDSIKKYRVNPVALPSDIVNEVCTIFEVESILGLYEKLNEQCTKFCERPINVAEADELISRVISELS